MEKTIFKLLLTISCLFSVTFTHISKKDIKQYNNNADTISLQHLGETDTDILFDSLVNKQTPLVQNDYYSNYYFMNLKSNFGNNAYGSCTYVAVGMLLSFYDSYWDDSFIPEVYDIASNVQTTTPSGADFDLIPLNSESPGIVFESNTLVGNLSSNEYLALVNQYSDTYFQFKLIELAKQHFGNEKFDTAPQPLGMNFSELQSFLNYYIFTYNSKSTGDVSISTASGSTGTVKSFTISKLLSGTPVLLRAKNSNEETGHAMIAYDYDSKSQEIFVHAGWRNEETGMALTHVSLKDLGYDILCDATSININYDYAYPRNYVRSNGTTIASSNYWIPRNIKLVSGNYRDTLPTFSWDGMFKEKWVLDKDPFYILSILNSSNYSIFKIPNIHKKEYTLTQEQWDYLLSTDTSSSYKIYIEMSSNTYPYWDDYWTKTSFSKPRVYDNLPSIAPIEYGFPDAYSTNPDVASRYTTHTTASGFTFQTRRFRTGYIHNEYIVMSPIRTGYKEAFIEYKFNTPVERIDVELSHWRVTSKEGLTSSTGIAGVDEFWGNTYTQKLDLLSTSTNLPTNRTYPTVYKIMFDHPVYQVKFYAETFNQITYNGNKGRICIGNMAFYVAENGMPLSGDELDYEPEKWNDAYVKKYNCYAYMLNTKAHGYMQPGNVSSFDEIADYNQLIKTVESDAEKYGFIFQRIGRYEKCPIGTYKVALVMDVQDNFLMPLEDRDYHWYRQNSDGTWSHKPGEGDVTNLDASNEIIVDPMECNRKFAFYLNYTVFVGYFAVSPLA